MELTRVRMDETQTHTYRDRQRGTVRVTCVSWHQPSAANQSINQTAAAAAANDLTVILSATHGISVRLVVCAAATGRHTTTLYDYHL